MRLSNDNHIAGDLWKTDFIESDLWSYGKMDLIATFNACADILNVFLPKYLHHVFKINANILDENTPQTMWILNNSTFHFSRLPLAFWTMRIFSLLNKHFYFKRERTSFGCVVQSFYDFKQFIN